MKQKLFPVLVSILLSPQIMLAQAVGINNTGAQPHVTAILDVSSSRQGMLIPRLTSGQRLSIANPAHGLLVYDSTQNALYAYDASVLHWKMVGESLWSKGAGAANIFTNNRIHVTTGVDASLTQPGYMMLGSPTGLNIIADNNEIMARNNGNTATLFLQAEGGKTQFGRNDDSNIEVEGTSVQAIFNGAAETLILQGALGGKVRLGDGFDFANTKLHISTGVDAGLTPAQSGFMMIGHSTGLNVVFDNNEILARNGGEPATLFLARDASKVQLGNGSEANGTKLHITSGFDVGLGNNTSGYIMMGSQSSTNVVLDNNEIQARNNGSAANLFLQNGGGNVFIGDQTPFSSVHRLGVNGNAVITGNVRIGNELTPAGYKMAVDGKIICTELMVRLIDDWPDYVFHKNYKLPALPEVQDFIKRHHHLPGIPSAADIEKTGVGIGEMQKLQMQKIEELTLYLIEMNKELKVIKEENKKLRSLIGRVD